jgi:hypothetical protein
VANFSALFTRYSGINHFEVIEAWVLTLHHKKINHGGEHVHLFKLVNIVFAGLSALLILALVRGHLLNQFMSFLNTESEEGTSSSSIYVLPGVDVSYAALQVYGIIKVALHQEYSLGIVFIFSHGRKDLFHV